jgi:hypothetical protein
MKKKRVPSDVIRYTFSFLKAGTRFKISKPEICEAFFEISKEAKFQILFKDISFNNTGTYVSCDAVFNALSNLSMAGLIVMIDLTYYEITEHFSKIQVSGLFSKKEIDLLKEMAKIFYEKSGAFLPPWHKDFRSG